MAILISAQMAEPFDPYQIQVKRSQRKEALLALASDLGAPRSWVDSAIAAVKKATPRTSVNPVGVAAALVGVGIVFAAGPLAVVLAPAGLAGGAAFLAGLAALGPGGLAGGISIIGAVGAVGGGTAIAGALSFGSAAQVEQRVVTLHANALAKRDLRPGTPVNECEVLQRMEAEVVADIEHREAIDEPNSPRLKEAQKKLKIVRSTLKRMKKLDMKLTEKDGAENE